MKSFLILPVLASSLLGLLPSVGAAEVSIVTVDVNRVLNESKGAQGRKKELDEVSLKIKKQVESKREQLKKLEETLKAKKVSEDSKEFEGFRSQARDYARFVKDAEEDLKKRFMKVNRELTEQAVKAVRDYAKKHNVDLVLDKSAEGRGPVLFGGENTDVTEAVVKEMNS